MVSPQLKFDPPVTLEQLRLVCLPPQSTEVHREILVRLLDPSRIRNIKDLEPGFSIVAPELTPVAAAKLFAKSLEIECEHPGDRARTSSFRTWVLHVFSTAAPDQSARFLGHALRCVHEVCGGRFDSAPDLLKFRDAQRTDRKFKEAEDRIQSLELHLFAMPDVLKRDASWLAIAAKINPEQPMVRASDFAHFASRVVFDDRPSQRELAFVTVLAANQRDSNRSSDQTWQDLHDYAQIRVRENCFRLDRHTTASSPVEDWINLFRSRL